MTRLSYFVKIGIKTDFFISVCQGSWSKNSKSLFLSTVSLSVKLAI